MALDEPWFCCGVVHAVDAEPKRAKSGTEYRTFQLSDLHCNTVRVCCFAPHTNAELAEGAVVAVISPQLMHAARPNLEASKRAVRTIVGLTLVRTSSLVVLGSSADWSRCSMSACSALLDARNGSLCARHLAQSFAAAAANRPGINRRTAAIASGEVTLGLASTSSSNKRRRL